MSDNPADHSEIDGSIPQSARVWNYWSGGKDHYPIDREVGDAIRAANPHIVEIARAQRQFLVRAVSYLAGDAGIRQFLDIGTGLPTANNTHEVAQAIAPESRIVYVDHDPLVLAHARALLVGSPEGATDYLDADLRDPEEIVRRASATLDLDRPVALMLLGILGHITDDAEAHALVRRLLDPLPPGSHLVACDDTNVLHPEQMDEMIRQWNASGESPRVNRTPDGMARFFDGLELLDPGVVSVSRWRPDRSDIGTTSAVDDFGGVAIKR